MRNMIKSWFKPSLKKKLIILYVICILLVVFLTTFTQVRKFVSTYENEHTENLITLTDQVSLNFTASQNSVGQMIYSRSVTFLIPSLMWKYNENVEMSRSALSSAVSLMVTNSTEYDFVMVMTLDGNTIDSGTSYNFTSDALSSIRENCNSLLSANQDNTHGTSQWYRGTDGGVYILKDVYETEPLRHVGRMIVHLRDVTFHLSTAYTDLKYLFFDKDGNYVMSTESALPDWMIRKAASFLRNGTGTERWKVDGIEYLAAQSSHDAWTAVGISSLVKFNEASRAIILRGLLYGILGIAIGIGLISFMLTGILKKINSLKESMGKVAEGDLDYRLSTTDEREDELTQLESSFNYMTKKVSNLMDKVVDEERAKKNAELEMLEYKYRSLETQIKPHFIFNALEVVNSMAKMKHESDIEAVVQKISSYFRNISRNNSRQFITVEQEFESLKAYTEIYQYIHGNSLKTEYHAKNLAKDAMIPTMIMQPIVENALEHGIRSNTEQSEIEVHAYKMDDMLCITVKDNGEGFGKEALDIMHDGRKQSSADQSGIGIVNVKERLKLLYGNKAEIEIMNREEGGAKVQITIPFEYTEPETGESDLLNELDEMQLHPYT